MSKAALKKELQKLTKDQLVEQILDLYNKNKAIREQYDLFLNPKLQPSACALADVMLTLPECACEFTANYGDMTEQFYTATVNNFVAALKLISKNGLQASFRSRAEQCVKWASSCGYGFADEMDEVYREFYS